MCIFYRKFIDSDPFASFTLDTSSTSSIPVVIDDMDNTFSDTFSSFPDRFMVFEHGKVAHFGATIVNSFGKLIPDQALEYLDDKYCK